jgi:hypothetical protein
MTRHLHLPLILLAGLLVAGLPTGRPAHATAQETAPSEIVWYGYLRLDMAHDTAVANPGNYALYVKPHARNDATSTLNITARQTRLGAHITRGTMKGRLEVDFYGASPENKNTVQLRYAVASIPLGSFTLEAGQTSDIISPLVPSTVNYSVAWGAGNVGYRRPQVKLIHTTPRTWVGLSLARNITGDLDGDTILDGDASAVPAVQARCALTPVDGDRKLSVGVSGHYGRCNCPAKDIDYSNWSVNTDVTIIPAAGWKILAEAYRGSNMGAYAGAIYNSDTVNGVHSQGAWANLQTRIGDSPFKLSLGAGIDDVDDEDLTKAELNRPDVRVRNQVAFVTGFYQLSPEVSLGLELSRWATEYANVTPGNDPEPVSLRLQWSMQANF